MIVAQGAVLVHLTKDHNSRQRKGEGMTGPANTKVWDYGDLGKEVWYSVSPWRVEGKERQRDGRGFMPKSLYMTMEKIREQAECNMVRLVRRARTKIRRLVYYHRLRFMWSLTIKAEVKDLSEAWALWVAFSKRLQYAGLLPDHYVVVPELQKRGVWHFHVCCDRYIDHKSLERLWSHGFVWISWGSAKKAAHYASKYVGKELGENEQRQAGERRFRSSLHSSVPSSEQLVEDPEGTGEGLLKILTEGGTSPVVGLAIDREEDGRRLGMWFFCERGHNARRNDPTRVSADAGHEGNCGAYECHTDVASRSGGKSNAC